MKWVHVLLLLMDSVFFLHRNYDGPIELSVERIHLNLNTFRGDAISLARRPNTFFFFLLAFLWRAAEATFICFFFSFPLFSNVLNCHLCNLRVYEPWFSYWKHIFMLTWKAKRRCNADTMIAVYFTTWKRQWQLLFNVHDDTSLYYSVQDKWWHFIYT